MVSAVTRAGRVMPARMQAMVQDTYGSAEVMHLRDIDRPEISADEVLIRVRAAGVNPADWAVMSGLPYIARPVYGLRKPKVSVRGTDVAGTVEAIGAGVTRFGVGDEVYGALTLLFSMLLSSFANFGVLQGLAVPGDAEATAANISASEGLFRLATAAFLAVALLDVLAAAALYVLSRPTNSRLAVLMAGARVAAAAVFVVGVTNLLDLAPAHVMASLVSFDRVWAMSLTFFGLHLLVLGVLLLRSAGFPRFIGVLAIVAGGGYLADSLVALRACQVLGRLNSRKSRVRKTTSLGVWTPS